MASNVEDPAPEIPDEEELPHAENENEEGAMTGVDSPEKNEGNTAEEVEDVAATEEDKEHSTAPRATAPGVGDVPSAGANKEGEESARSSDELNREQATAVVQKAARAAIDRGALAEGDESHPTSRETKVPPASGTPNAVAVAMDALPDGGVAVSITAIPVEANAGPEQRPAPHGLVVQLSINADSSVSVEISPRKGSGEALGGGGQGENSDGSSPGGPGGAPAAKEGGEVAGEGGGERKERKSAAKGNGKRPKAQKKAGDKDKMEARAVAGLEAAYGSPRAEGTDRARASTVEKLEVKLAAKIEELDLGAVSQLLAAAERMGLPQSNTVVELGRALVYLNSLANEVSYACRFRQVEILPRALDAIACVAPGTSEGQEVELDERTSEQYRRAQHAIEAAQLDLQASVAIELGDTERMEEIEAQAQQDGHHQVAARVRAGRQLEETKATVRVWLEEKEEEARRARQARIDKKREQKRAEKELAERRKRNEIAFQAWLERNKERKNARKGETRVEKEEDIEEFLKEEEERKRENEAKFEEWLRLKKEQKVQAKARTKVTPRNKRLESALRASRELEEKAFAVLEQGWSYDVKFKLGQPPQKAKKAEEGTVSNV